jgi:hypothetical protein
MNQIINTSKIKNIFVSGPPRSGTTLLELVLSAHSMITITPETRFIQQLFDRRISPDNKLGKNEIESTIQMMKEDIKLNSWPKFSLDVFLKQYPMSQEVSVAEILNNLFEYYAKKMSGGTEYLGNKKGLYAGGYGPYTKTIFPNAKFVYIVRDPRDVIRSVLTNFSEQSLKKAAITYINRCHNILKMMKGYPSDTLIVRYEDLVSDPERVCRRICDFLNVPFDEQMLTFYELNLNGAALISLSKKMHINTTTPFNPDLIGQWMKKDFFTTKDIETIEALTYNYMKRFGYKFESQISKIQSIFIRLKILVLSRYQIFKDKIATSQAS